MVRTRTLRLLGRLLLLLLLVGCAKSPRTSLTQPVPTSVAQAESMKASGVTWTNEEIRSDYNRLVATIGPANEQWKQEGLSAEERAHRAYQIRHDARLTTRAMMASRDEVSDLRLRDQAKYGNPDGPTFAYLVERGKEKGLTGDALYEGIVESAQRTDATVNAAFGAKR